MARNYGNPEGAAANPPSRPPHPDYSRPEIQRVEPARPSPLERMAWANDYKPQTIGQKLDTQISQLEDRIARIKALRARLQSTGLLELTPEDLHSILSLS